MAARRKSSYVKGYDRKMEKWEGGGGTMVGSSGTGKVFWQKELVQFVVSS